MLKINVLVLGKYIDRLTGELGDCGLIHLVHAAHQSQHQLLQEVDTTASREELQSLAQKCNFLINALGLEAMAAEAAQVEAVKDIVEIRQNLDRIYEKFQAEDTRINELLTESGNLTRRYERLEKYPLRRVDLSELRDLDYVYFTSGRLPPSQLDKAVAQVGERGLVLHQHIPESGQEEVLIVGSRKNRWAIESELKNLPFDQHEVGEEDKGTVEDQLSSLSDKLSDVKEAITRHRDKLRQMAGQYGGWLLAAERHLRQALALVRAKQHFGKTSDLYCISGWVPRDEIDKLSSVVNDVTNGTGVVESILPEDDFLVRQGEEQVPVEFQPVGFLKPFQRIIAAFGAPRYDEVEASLFVALSFVLMFGVMFGDVGQGAVIMLAGLFMLKSKSPFIRKISDVGYMLLMCGGGSVIFGFLYGSFFGSEEVLPHIWISPLQDIMELFKVAVVIGIVCISIGILINIYNKLKARDYLNGVLDKFGIIGIIFYWGAIGLGIKAFVAGQLNGLEIFLVIVLPLIILFVREPLYHLLRRDKKLFEENVFGYIMHAAVEVMETITIFLGSTVSFIRVGAFALSHAGLCLAIYSIAETLGELPGGGIWAVTVIVVGNISVILLEGLIVSIQGVRLQYYELFSKYFSGDGVLYEPFSTR
ncbi:MAG: V-type ATPase 116kDa subunit family protein [Lentisphaeria bacterium]